MSMNHRDTIAAQESVDLTTADFARVHRVTAVDLISEGPIVGLCEGMKSIYLNDDAAADVGTLREDSIIPDTAPEGEDRVENTAVPTITFNNLSFPGNPTVTASIVDDRIYDSGNPNSILGPETVEIKHGFTEDGTCTQVQRVFDSNGQMVLRFTKTGAAFNALPTDPYPFVAGTVETAIALGEVLDVQTGANLGIGTFRNVNGNSIDFLPAGGMTPADADNFISQTNVANNHFRLFSTTWIKVVGGFGTTTLELSPVATYLLIPNGTYFYGALGTAPTKNEVDGDTGIGTGKMPGIAAEFRTGELVQMPMTDYGRGMSGAPVSISNGSGFQQKPLEFKDDESDTTTDPADPAQFLGTASAGFNLTPAQAKAVDEVELTFSYNSLVVLNQSNGDKINAIAQYHVTLEIIRNNEKTAVNLHDANNPLTHINTTQTPISNLLSITLTPFKPFDDFNVIVERKTRFDGLGLEPSTVEETNAQGEIVTKTVPVSSPHDTKKIQAVASITRLVSRIYNPLTYPLTAMCQVAFTSKNFPGTPTRTYECFGRKVKIPSNYTPRPLYNSANVAATYTGLWDGTFRSDEHYTDNPAWIFYDILTNNRYGLGDWIEEEDVDIYSLYRISKYCDELVPDGKGGQEPRYRANIYLTKATDAYKVVKDMATTFLGLLYWMDGKITTIADQPRDPIYVFNKTNTLNGEFVYEGTGSKTRANQIVVSWNNPRSNYRIEPLIVEDSEDIATTGRIISEEAMAFGCTSEGQATRYGRWKLWTSKNQTELVRFSTSIDAGFLAPGDVITVQDNDRYATTLGGRIAKYNATFGKTATGTYAEDTSFANSTAGFQSTNVAQTFVGSGSAKLHTAYSSGDFCLFEFGQLTHGTWLGVKDIAGVRNLVFRTGGSSNASSGDTIVLSKPISEIPEFDNQAHTITWEMRPGTPAQASLWIDGTRYLHGTTTGGTDILNGRWAHTSSADGSWGKGVGQAVAQESIQPWPSAMESNLSVYNNSATNENQVFLDRAVEIDNTKTYTLSIVLPQAQDATQEGEERPMKTETKSLDSSWLSGLTYVGGTAEVSYLQTSSDFSDHAISGSVFVLTESTPDGVAVEGSGKEYKIMTISEQEQGVYTVVASEYSEGKYAAVESEEGFTVVRDPKIYPTVGEYDKVPPVRDLKAVVTPDITASGTSTVISWDPPVNTDGTPYDLVAAYEISHNIPDIVNPINVGPLLTNFSIKDVPLGSYQIRVQTMNNVRNRSMPRLAALNVTEDSATSNITRDLGGVGVGGKITKPITLVEGILSVPSTTKIYPAASPLEPQTGPFASLDTNSVHVPPGESSILLDADAKAFKCITPFTEQGHTYFIDAIASAGGGNGRFTQVLDEANSSGNPVIASYNGTTKIVTGTTAGTSPPKFTRDIKVGDIIKFSTGSTFNEPAMKVVSVINDTTFKVTSGSTTNLGGKSLHRNALRIDNSVDTIIGRLDATPVGTFANTLTHNPIPKNGSFFIFRANQALDVRISIHLNTANTFIKGYIATSGFTVDQAMLDTVSLGLQYRIAGENRPFSALPGYNTTDTFTKVVAPTSPNSSQFQVVVTDETGAWTGTRKQAVIANGGAVANYTTSGGATSPHITVVRDVHLEPGTYEFRCVTTKTGIGGIPTNYATQQDQHLQYKGESIVQDGFFNNATITTTGTDNTAPLIRKPAAFSQSEQQLTHVFSPKGQQFTTEMTVDRTEVDILQPTDELVYHWQFNDILGSSITESIEGEDGEAES